MHDSLYSYVTENNMIYPRQSGFRKNHSTDTALIQISDKLLYLYQKFLTGHWPTGFHSAKKRPGFSP